jgi:CheY-like chemotaxis protein
VSRCRYEDNFNTDNDQHARFLVKELLNKEGFQTVEAANGSEAFELIKKESNELAIVDIIKSYIDGYKLTEEIRNIPKFISKC